jgi:hypothetical protein
MAHPQRHARGAHRHIFRSGSVGCRASQETRAACGRRHGARPSDHVRERPAACRIGDPEDAGLLARIARLADGFRALYCGNQKLR